MKKFSSKYLALVGTLLLALGAAYGFFHTNTKEEAAPKQVPLVRTLTLQPSTAQNTASYPGTVAGRYESTLAFQIGGKIIKRYVNNGDTVTKGQLLLALDPQDMAENLTAAQGQLATAQAQYDLAAANHSRFTTLYKAGAVSQAVLDQYQTQLKAAQATLQQAQAATTIAQHKLDYTGLYSDATGVITNLNCEVGQIVAAGTPLLKVVDQGQYEIQINVAEKALPQLQLGQRVNIQLWAQPDLPLQGQIREIAAAADPATKTFKTCVTILNRPPTVRLGMTAKVILGQDGPAPLLIPLTAVYDQGQGPHVWLVKNNKTYLQPVTLGQYYGNQVQVLKGLEAGAILITAGVNKLSPGQQVQPLKEGEAYEGEK